MSERPIAARPPDPRKLDDAIHRALAAELQNGDRWWEARIARPSVADLEHVNIADLCGPNDPELPTEPTDADEQKQAEIEALADSIESTSTASENPEA